MMTSIWGIHCNQSGIKWELAVIRFLIGARRLVINLKSMFKTVIVSNSGKTVMSPFTNNDRRNVQEFAIIVRTFFSIIIFLKYFQWRYVVDLQVLFPVVQPDVFPELQRVFAIMVQCLNNGQQSARPEILHDFF